MAAFTHMISIWPISISIAENLSLGDLLNLSRLSSECRCALHGFPYIPTLKSASSRRTVRPYLYIGQHRTSYWQGLKQASLKQCSERNHTQGSTPQCCRRCSMPVCEGCIVKENYKKNEPTFKSRCRYLCIDCWTSGTPHVGRHTTGPPSEFTLSYNFAPGNGDFCVCNVRDGWLCASCKNEQNLEAKITSTCAGESCNNFLEEDKESRRICLWCDLPLIKRQHRSSNRDPKKEYKFDYSCEGLVVEDDSKPEKDRARPGNTDRRRFRRFLRPDDTGAKYFRLGARRQRRNTVLGLAPGDPEYEHDSLLQSDDIRANEHKDDWPGTMQSSMQSSRTRENGDPEDGFARDSEVTGRKRKTDEDDEADDVESSMNVYEKGKENAETRVEKETGTLQDHFSQHDETLPEREGVPPPEKSDEEIWVVRETGLSDTSENEGHGNEGPEGDRADVDPNERPPDYSMREDDLLLGLDGFLNGN